MILGQAGLGCNSIVGAACAALRTVQQKEDAMQDKEQESPWALVSVISAFVMLVVGLFGLIFGCI